MSNIKDEIKQFMSTQDHIDYGKKPLEKPLTEDQRKLASLAMATNAALVQFVLEGIIPFEHQGHFMGHLADFAERIYRGEGIQLPNTTQTLAVDSVAGKLYADAAVDELENGHKNFTKMKQKMAEQAAEEAETTLSEDVLNKQGSKPTLH